jgi:hypothetical protein
LWSRPSSLAQTSRKAAEAKERDDQSGYNLAMRTGTANYHHWLDTIKLLLERLSVFLGGKFIDRQRLQESADSCILVPIQRRFPLYCESFTTKR